MDKYQLTEGFSPDFLLGLAELCRQGVQYNLVTSSVPLPARRHLQCKGFSGRFFSFGWFRLCCLNAELLSLFYWKPFYQVATNRGVHKGAMVAWTTTRLSVSEVNALISAVSMVVSFCMSLMLASVSLELRRLMIIWGERDAIVQDEGYTSIWKLCKSSKASRWTALAVLPVLVSIAASTIIDFTTSGVSASIGHTEGAEVHVMGLVGNEVTDSPSFPTINSLAEAASSGISIDTAYLALLSSDLASVGFASSFSGVEVKYVRSLHEEQDGVYVYGNEYEAGRSVDITFCVEVKEIADDAFAINECREGLIVDKTVQSFDVKYIATNAWAFLDQCSPLYEGIALGNQAVDIVERDFMFESGDADGRVAANATCSSIFESIIEACVWEDGGILYFGDWSVGGAGNCAEENNVDIPSMAILAIDYGEKMEQGGDTAVILSSMTAEIFSGTGLLSSRQQLVDVLGAVVRLESMAWAIQSAYDPVDVVEIGISAWVLVVLLLALLLPAMVWVPVKWHSRGKNIFLPVSPAEWSACAARELDELRKEDGPRSLGTAKPLDEHYGQVYAFGPVVSADEGFGGSQQRLGWVNRDDATSAITEKPSPFRSNMCGGRGAHA